MSNISDERLIVAAVKDNDSDALEALKDRVITGEYGIRDALRIPCSDVEKKRVEQYIVEHIVEGLHNHGFIGSIRSFGFRVATHFSIQYRDHNRYELSDLERSEEKALQPAPSTLNDLHKKVKHPPLEEIDLEIRPLVSLLNQVPYIRTTGSSCSGHPTREDPDPYGGYIGIASFGNGNILTTMRFIVDLLMLLDNSNRADKNVYLPASLQIARDSRNDHATSTEAIRERYMQVEAENLYSSDIPIILAYISYRFYVCHQEVKQSLKIWKQLLACVKEMLPEDEGLTTEVDTPEKVRHLLAKLLHKLPFIFSATNITSHEGYLGISLNTLADLDLCMWFYTLVNGLHDRLEQAGYVCSADSTGNVFYAEKFRFTLRPFLNQELFPLPHLLTPKWEPRTPEDHLKIWKLLELVVAEQIENDKLRISLVN